MKVRERVIHAERAKHEKVLMQKKALLTDRSKGDSGMWLEES